MGREFHDNYSEVRELFQNAGDILGMDIGKLCFQGPDDVLVLTENMQPAITVVNLACLVVLRLHEIYPAAAAGHSLGEFSALYAAGSLSLEDTFKLVRLRGSLMQEAAEIEQGGMAAIMELEEGKIREACALTGAEVANINCPGQIIITGPFTAVDGATKMCEKAGAIKCVKLKVSGPWHSRCMEHARAKFDPFIDECVFKDPQIPVVRMSMRTCSIAAWRFEINSAVRSAVRSYGASRWSG